MEPARPRSTAQCKGGAAVETNLGIVQKIQSFFSSKPVFEDFERAIISAVCKQLPARDLQILQSQIARFNKSYMEYDEVRRITETYFYWMRFGSSRQDFPLKWPVSNNEWILAKARIEDGKERVFLAELTVVLGRFFSIRIHSNTELDRPLSPQFTISSIEVFDPETATELGRGA
jgi:hypothetical protein